MPDDFSDITPPTKRWKRRSVCCTKTAPAKR